MKKRLALSAICASLLLPGLAFGQTPCPALKQVAQVQMVRDASGVNWVPVRVNDTQKLFALNLGNEWTQIFAEAASDLKLPSSPLSAWAANQTGEVVDTYGNRSNKLVVAQSLKVGAMPVAEDSWLLSDPRRYFIAPIGNPAYGTNKLLAGKLGYSTLRNYDIDLDFGSNVLGLFSRDHCAGQVVYWTQEPVAVIPFELSAKAQIRLPVKLDGVALTAIIDTGIPHTTLNQNVAAEDMHIDLAASDVQKETVSGVSIYHRQFKTLELKGISFSNLKLEIIPDWMRAAKLGAIKGNPAPSSISLNTSSSILSGSTVTMSGGGGPVPNPEDRLPDLIIGADILNKLHIYIETKEWKLYVASAGAKQ